MRDPDHSHAPDNGNGRRTATIVYGVLIVALVAIVAAAIVRII
jgi:hypothetical protein